MTPDDLTSDDLAFIRKRAHRYATNTPWLVDELVSRVCVKLVQRPDLIADHPLSQAVNMLLKSTLLDLYKLREQLPSGASPDEWDTRLPPVSLDDDEQEWERLRVWLSDIVNEFAPREQRPRSAHTRRTSRRREAPPVEHDRTATSAVLVAQGLSHAEVASLLGVSKSVVSRDLARARTSITLSRVQ